GRGPEADARAGGVRVGARLAHLAVPQRARPAAVPRVLRERDRDVAPRPGVAPPRGAEARKEAADPRHLRPRRVGPVDRRADRRRAGGLIGAQRTTTVNGETGEIAPSGRVTVYGR